MRMKKIAATMLVVALSCGSAMSSIAATWVKVGQSDWKFQKNDGSMMTDSWLQHTDGKWYFLGEDGMMRKGWYKDKDQKWYFLNGQGAMQTGLIEVDSKVYFMEEKSGELFVGEKTMPNGMTYNFGLNGSTNGAPFTAQKFNGNGDIVAPSTTSSVPGGSSGSSSGDSFVPTISTEAADAINSLTAKVEAIEKEYEDVISSISVGGLKVLSSSRVEVPVNVDLKKAEAVANLSKTRDAVKAAAQELIKKTTGPVTLSLGDIERKFSAEEVNNRLDEFADKWVTEEKLDLYGKNIGSVGIVIDGVKLTYKISLDF